MWQGSHCRRGQGKKTGPLLFVLSCMQSGAAIVRCQLLSSPARSESVVRDRWLPVDWGSQGAPTRLPTELSTRKLGERTEWSIPWASCTPWDLLGPPEKSRRIMESYGVGSVHVTIFTVKAPAEFFMQPLDHYWGFIREVLSNWFPRNRTWLTKVIHVFSPVCLSGLRPQI